MFQTELFGAGPIFGFGAGKLQTELSGDISGAIFGSGAQYISGKISYVCARRIPLKSFLR